MQIIGKIDIELFKKISTNIITDEVVLTDKQKEHIKERHAEVLEKYESYFKDIVENLDYILKDRGRENTAMILKTINEAKGSVNLILRLAVEGEDENNKNSIITCIPIGNSRLKNYIKNGNIIYKKE